MHMHNKKNCGNRNNGWTLLEIILVAFIILSLTALILSVVLSGKKGAYTVSCTGNLRNIHVALELYRETSDGHFPLRIETLYTVGLTPKSVHLCPSDPVEGFASKHYFECSKKKVIIPNTYETMLDWPEKSKAVLSEVDPNHGIVVCRVHGAKTEFYADGVANFCDASGFMFEGLLLRLRRDSSIQRAKLSLHHGPPPNVAAMKYWELYTDEAPDFLKRLVEN